MQPCTYRRRTPITLAFAAGTPPPSARAPRSWLCASPPRHQFALLAQKQLYPRLSARSPHSRPCAALCTLSNFGRSTPPPRPPGREDEFEDANGDDLEESESKSVATLSRDTERSFDTVLQELTAIQQDGPRNVAILGTRYTSYLHQQIIELLTYANVLVGNHVFTSGAGGTNAAVIRGALRAEKPQLLTVVLPQSLHKQPKETQEQVCNLCLRVLSTLCAPSQSTQRAMYD